MVYKIRVSVYCASNDLHGSVDVIARNSIAAQRLARNGFFAGKGWEIILEDLTNKVKVQAPKAR